MRILTCECSVVYSGRGNTTLDKALRAIIIKDDGSVGIHNDVGNKPINYMGKGNSFTETVADSSFADGVERVWRFDARKEYIEITIYKTLMELNAPLDKDVGLVRDGTEDSLQEWLHNNSDVLQENLFNGCREFPTSAGNIDLMFWDGMGNLHGFEVKRVAMLPAVDQCLRYQRALEDAYAGTLNDAGNEIEINVTLVALDVRPNTVVLAAKRKVPYIIVPADWNKKEE